MNREIRFRAWWNNEMHYDSHHKPDVKCEVMQYTGLKDKNGKEIYEGDVVKCQQGCNHEIRYVDDIGGEFGGGLPGFCLEGLRRNCGKGYAWTGEEEVIGNIYENPELIEKV